MGTNPPISIYQPSPHFEHRRRRLPVVFKLPRQSEMDDHSASPPSEPRKNRGTTLTHGQQSSTLGSPCMVESPTENRNESPLSPRDMSFSPEQRASPVAGEGTPPPLPSSSGSFSGSSPPCPPPNGGDPSEDESIALARLLMAQEAVESYAAFSSDYLRYNTAQYSQEDLAALQAALEDDDDDDDVSDEQDGGGGGANDLQYELMLRLGEAIGDVKHERWKMVSERHISLLPTFQFKPSTTQDLDENDSRCKCLICQFSYDEGECLRTLPCGHCFHAECVDQWLKDKDCCAYCRQPIVA